MMARKKQQEEEAKLVNLDIKKDQEEEPKSGIKRVKYDSN